MPPDYQKLERLVKVNRRDKLSEITVKFNENANPASCCKNSAVAFA